MLTSLYLSIGIHRRTYISNGKFSLSAPLPLLWVIPSSIDVYETSGSSNSRIKKTESKADYLSRRYFADGSIKGRIRDREGHIDFSITTSMSDKNHRIPWDYNKFDQNGIVSLSKERSINSNAMSENIGPEISVCKGGLSVDRNIILNCPSSPTSSFRVLLPTETTNRRIKNFFFLRKTKSIIYSKQSRDSMVGSQFEIKQWKVFSMETPSVHKKIGCIKGRLEGYCQDKRTGFPWSEEERKLHFNVLELKAVKFAILAFTQNTKHGCSFLSSKDERMNNRI